MRICIALLLIAISADARVRPVHRPAPDPIVQYRGDAGRSGVVSGSGPRTFTRVAWQTPVGAEAFSAPVYANGSVYASTGTGRLVALDASTGAIRWTSESLGAFNSPATIAGDVVYVSGENKRTYALSATSGATLWSFLVDDWSVGAPLVTKGVLYLGTEAGSVYAIDVASRAQRWRFTANHPVHATLALDEGRLVFAAIDTLYALDAATGQELWRKTRDGVWFNFTLNDGVVFTTANNGDVYALDARSGIECWRVGAPNTFWTPPAVVNGIVILTNDQRRVVALDALTGTMRWTRDVSAVPTEALIADAVVYVASGTPQAFEVATGAELFSAAAGAHVYTGLAVGDGKLFVQTSRGLVLNLQ